MRVTMPHSLAAMLLLVNFFIVASLGLALPNTLSMLPDGCTLVDGNILCTDESTESALRALDAEAPLNISTALFERAAGNFDCDSNNPKPAIPKSSIRNNVAGTFCKRIDNQQLRSNSVSMIARDPDTKVTYRLFIGTTIGWVYAIEETRCTEMFMRVIDHCSGISTSLMGGRWYDENLTYMINILIVGQ